MSEVSKVIYGSRVLIDLTADTVDADHLLKGKTAHNKAGETITGTCEFDSNTTDADASASEILAGRSAYVNKTKVTGTMVNNGGIDEEISTKDQEITVPNGFHDGSGKVKIADAEKTKIIPSNIRKDVVILGVTGTMTGSEDVKAQTKTATPSNEQQEITPDTGFNYLSQVTVLAIPYQENLNPAGGLTVSIG